MVTMPADSAKNATPEMVTMPAGQTNSGPRKPVFHPGPGVEGVILPPQITLEPKQSALSAAETQSRRHSSAPSQQRRVQPASGLAEEAKRQRSQESPAPSAKKSQVQTGKSFAQIARKRILIGVLDRGNQDGRIPRNQWRWVDSALATQCLQLLEKEPGQPPICKDVGWYQGNVKVIACDDNRSAELYKAAVSNLGEINLHHCKAASAALLLRLAGGGADIVLIQEPWVVGGKVSGLGSADYKLFVANAQVMRITPGAPASSNKASVQLYGHSLCSRQVLNEVPLNPSLFSPSNIAWAINSFKPFKSPGPDGIAPAHLQRAGKTAINWHQSIFTGIFRTGKIPEPWKNSKIVFIPKAGKASHITAKVFRPISLTSFLLKTFERILSLHLRAISPCDLTSNSQHAYRKGRSTETALHSVTATIDIEGAFNNVFPDAITEALTDLGIEGRLVGLINQLLTSRAVTSTLGSSTLTRDEWTSATSGQEGALSFYTDGSKQNNQVGGGVFSQQLGINHSFRLPDHCSVFQAEILAINEALSALNCSHVTSGTVNIYSDSQAAIMSIAATTTKSTSVSICRRSLHEMAEHFDIQLIWVLGHQDIPGNCIADERSLTGQWLIGIHAQRLNSPYNDFCRSCRDEEEEESPEHFFCFCPALSSRRFRFLGKPFLDGLGDLASLSPRKIAQFVQSSNWTPF
ncbi:hypothetical protein ACLKA7_000675 [Drosophila subpalustris]